MKPQRKQRLMLVGFLFLGTAAAVGFLLMALQQSVDLFYPPDKIVSGEAPIDKRMRAGGMVLEGSVRRDDSLDVSFTLSDMAGSDFEVRYTGILPDLFREGQGIVATGKLTSDGVFMAEQVLAKHDENYMPPELANMAANIEDAAGSKAGGGVGEQDTTGVEPLIDRGLPKTVELPSTGLPSGQWGSDS